MKVYYGIIIGMIYFIVFENSPSNSFYSTCWIRKQSKLLVHNKVYILGSFIIYSGIKNNDILLTILGGSWIGLHAFQDIGERINERRRKNEKNRIQ